LVVTHLEIPSVVVARLPGTSFGRFRTGSAVVRRPLAIVCITVTMPVAVTAVHEDVQER